jgi:fido (protein-threonine AMPylation protein)
MARNFEYVQAAGLCDGIDNIADYERLVSIGQGTVGGYLKILIDENSPLLAPKPDELLLLYSEMFKQVYKGAGKDFRPGEFGRIPLDLNESGNQRNQKFGADHKIIRSELQKLSLETNDLFTKAARQTSEGLRRLDCLHTVCFWHYRFQRIHPFKDGNGRLGRLVSNHQIHYMIDRRAKLLANAAEETKNAYITALLKTGRRNNLWPLEKFVAQQINLSTGRPIFSEQDIASLNDQRSPAVNPLASWDPGNR